MDILINGEKFQVFEGDIEDTVIDRYCVENDTLPRYLFVRDQKRIQEGIEMKSEDIFWEIGPDLSLIILDLKTIIETINPGQLNDFFSQDMNYRWPDVDAKEYGVLWIQETGFKYEIDDITPLQTLDLTAFSSPMAIRATIEDEQSKIQKDYESLDKRVKKQEIIERVISRITPVGVGEFQREVVRLKIKIGVSSEVNLLNIFDAITLDENLPFVALFWENKRYYKVYEKVIPNSDWILELETKQPLNSLAFKILRSKIRKTLYMNALWLVDNTLRYAYDSRTDKEYIEKIVLNSITTIPLQKKEEEIMSVTGTMSVRNLEVNKIVFLDMITSDIVLNKYLMHRDAYISSSDEDLVQDIQRRTKRFYVYWWPQRTEDYAEHFYFTFATTTVENVLTTIFSISRIDSWNKVERFRILLGKFMGRYLAKYHDVVQIYSTYVSNFNIILSSTEEKEKKEMKTKLKVLPLRKIAGEKLISATYAKECPEHRQPRIVATPEGITNPHKIMKFPKEEGHYYVCDHNVRDTWPGLGKPKAKRETEQPYIPCCFTRDQYVGKTKLREYLEEGPSAAEIGAETTTIVGPGKVPAVHQNGELPFNIFRMISLFYPGENIQGRILRLAAIRDKNSFIHACLWALSPEYRNALTPQKTTMAAQYRQEFLKRNVLIGAQELYDMSERDIQNSIRDTNNVFSPILYVYLVEILFSVYVLLFRYNQETNQEGEALIPAHIQAWLNRPFNPKFRGLILVIESPYGCEIVHDKRGGENSFIFTDPRVIQNLINFYVQNIYRVQNVSKINNRLIPYDSSILNLGFIRDSTGQYIDKNGKVRALFYGDNLYMSISPLPPLDRESTLIPPEDVLDWDDVEPFLQRYNLATKIVGRNENGILLRLPFGSGFIKTTIPSDTDFPRLPETFRDSLFVAQFDELNRFQYLKTVALYLKEYTLFIYSKFQEITFVVRGEDHNYVPGLTGSLSLENEYFVEEGKSLIVPSQEIQRRLVYYLELMLTNAYQDILGYKFRTRIQGEYTSIRDFNFDSDEIIFLSIESIIHWLIEISQPPLNMVQNQIYPYRETPYFYQDYRFKNGEIVILQNVFNGNLKSALNVAALWLFRRYNLGFYSEEIKGKPSFFEYEALSGAINFIPGDIEADLYVIKYDPDNYGAILFI